MIVPSAAKSSELPNASDASGLQPPKENFRDPYQVLLLFKLSV
jgi:hypothetical protein